MPRDVFDDNESDVLGVPSTSHPALEYVKTIVMPSGVRSPGEIITNGQALFNTSFNDGKILPWSLADLENPAPLTPITGLNGPSDLDVRGHILVAREQNSPGNVVTYNIRNPASIPAALQTIALRQGQRMGLGSKWALFGGSESGTNTLGVLDIKDPTVVSIEKGTVVAGTTHRGVVAIDDDHFAVASRDTTSVLIINISEAGRPRLIKTVTGVTAQPTPIICRWPYVYVGSYASTGKLTIIDVRNPTNAYIVGSCDIVGQPEDLALYEDSYVLACGRGDSGVLRAVGLIDVRNPATPEQIDTYDLSGVEGQRLQRMCVYNNYVYVTGDNAVSPAPGNLHILKLRGNGRPAPTVPVDKPRPQQRKKVHPGYVSGRYYTLHEQANMGTGAAQTLGRLWLTPYMPGEPLRLDRIGVNVTSATATAVQRLGLYLPGSDNLPSELLLDAGTVDCSTTGAKEITINISLSDVVWVATVSQTASAQLTRVNAVTLSNFLGTTAIATTTVGSGAPSAYSQDSVTGALPTTLGALSTQNGAGVMVWGRAL